jgi:hypothetical protein
MLVKWKKLNNHHDQIWKQLGALHDVKVKRAPWVHLEPQEK